MKTGELLFLEYIDSAVIFVCKINNSPVLLINDQVIMSNNKFVKYVCDKFHWTHYAAKQYIKQHWGNINDVY